jgi:aarF domain-containing kinase
MFPSELCSALTSLQANAPEHSWAFTEAQIQVELGKSVDEVFEYFSRKPLASGSIAQVYRARLNGRDVAVKVRHPHGSSPSPLSSPLLSSPLLSHLISLISTSIPSPQCVSTLNWISSS